MLHSATVYGAKCNIFTHCIPYIVVWHAANHYILYAEWHAVCCICTLAYHFNRSKMQQEIKMTQTTQFIDIAAFTYLAVLFQCENYAVCLTYASYAVSL